MLKPLLGLLAMLGATLLVLFWKPTYEALHIGNTMGTTYRVKWLSNQGTEGTQEIRAGIDDQLEDINRRMSTYLPDSELSRFNRSSGSDWFAVSVTTAEVVKEALRIADLTQGAFDPTIGPLVDLWGFGSGEDRIEPPSDQEIAATISRIGFERLELRGDAPALRKQAADLEIDLSAIAKGYAVDRVAGFLAGHEVENFMVEVGGEVRAQGQSLADRPWRVAVERPHIDKLVAHRVLPLSDLAMATSGTYRNYFDAGGRRYSHTIDPASGWPIDHHTISVSVIHPSCMTADALATALLVLGADRGLQLAEKNGLTVLFMREKNDRIEEIKTSHFRGRFGKQP